jgi:hypothetical protein
MDANFERAFSGEWTGSQVQSGFARGCNCTRKTDATDDTTHQ